MIVPALACLLSLPLAALAPLPALPQATPLPAPAPAVPRPAQVQAANLAGFWEGAIVLPTGELAVELELSRGKGEDWKGLIAIPLQGLRDFAASDLSIRGRAIAFGMAPIPGSPRFQGELAPDGRITGTFTQNGQSFPFHLRRGKPETETPLPAGLREVALTVGEEPWTLPAILTLPAGPGPWPGAVLVHGSGAQDRDERIGPNRPFRDLAWGLAQRGVAVLRYDKRSKAHGVLMTQRLGERTTPWEETIEDAVLAATLLRNQPGVDASRVAVLGHSQGGHLMPRIGKAAPFLAGLASLAGPSQPMEDLILQQVRTMKMGAEMEARMGAQVARVKALKPGETVPGKELPLGIPAAWWLYLKGYDPAAEARALPQALFFLQGGCDAQVGLSDLEGWRKGLQGHPGATFRSYPGLNHLFMASDCQNRPEELMKPAHVDGRVIEDLAAWLQGLKGRKGQEGR